MANNDVVYMARALKLAEKGRYTTDPNPRVGCVLVKNGEVIAQGWHLRAGLAHAEIEALQQTEDAKGATAYVTLEPCSHVGKTGPCCDALIAAGVEKVVVAMQDPNPLVSGQGIEKMREAGLRVDVGLLQQDAENLNRGFIKRMSKNLPYICSKMAMSLDGRTAMASGESQWITSKQSRVDVQQLRAQSSVILTGINTVLADDPSLNVRGFEEELTQPIRVILDSQLKMPVTAKMNSLPGQTWVLTCSKDEQKKQQLESAGCQVFLINGKNSQLDLAAVMVFLAEQQINNVLVEAGAVLNAALLIEGLVDEWLIYMAPCILGDKGRGLFALPKLDKMADKKQLKMVSTRQVGADLRMTFQQK